MRILDEVYVGKKEELNKKFALLANIAQDEMWTFRAIKDTDPFKIMRNYFFYTYNRLREENKLLLSTDEQYLSMNTGLLTKYDQEIVALFAKNERDGSKQAWYFVGFFKENDKQFTSHFSEIPKMANYYKNASDLIYDSNLELRLQKEHIIDDNFIRFSNVGFDNKELISVFLDVAKGKLEKKLKRNFKLALPFYYHNTEIKEDKIQLLAPLYFPSAPVKLALVINKVKTETSEYYEGITILPVELAYMNSRLIVKPDEEWARIMDEVDSLSEELAIDKVE